MDIKFFFESVEMFRPKKSHIINLSRLQRELLCFDPYTLVSVTYLLEWRRSKGHSLATYIYSSTPVKLFTV